MLAAAGLAGVGLGDWFAAQAPHASETTRANLPQANNELVLDASGRPFVPEPPQPLIDGSQGVPPKASGLAWEVQPLSLFDGFIDPMVIISRDGQSYTVGDMLSQAGRDLPQGPADIQTLDVTSPTVSSVTATEVIPAQSQSAQPTQPPLSWQDQLKNAVDTCQKGGFFSRPSCLERAREQFCTPNDAWGKHPLCPAKTGTSPLN